MDFTKIELKTYKKLYFKQYNDIISSNLSQYLNSVINSPISNTYAVNDFKPYDYEIHIIYKPYNYYSKALNLVEIKTSSNPGLVYEYYHDRKSNGNYEEYTIFSEADRTKLEVHKYKMVAYLHPDINKYKPGNIFKRYNISINKETTQLKAEWGNFKSNYDIMTFPKECYVKIVSLTPFESINRDITNFYSQLYFDRIYSPLHIPTHKLNNLVCKSIGLNEIKPFYNKSTRYLIPLFSHEEIMYVGKTQIMFWDTRFCRKLEVKLDTPHGYYHIYSQNVGKYIDIYSYQLQSIFNEIKNKEVFVNKNITLRFKNLVLLFDNFDVINFASYHQYRSILLIDNEYNKTEIPLVDYKPFKISRNRIDGCNTLLSTMKNPNFENRTVSNQAYNILKLNGNQDCNEFYEFTENEGFNNTDMERMEGIVIENNKFKLLILNPTLCYTNFVEELNIDRTCLLNQLKDKKIHPFEHFVVTFLLNTITNSIFIDGMSIPKVKNNIFEYCGDSSLEYFNYGNHNLSKGTNNVPESFDCYIEVNKKPNIHNIKKLLPNGFYVCINNQFIDTNHNIDEYILAKHWSDTCKNYLDNNFTKIIITNSKNSVEPHISCKNTFYLENNTLIPKYKVIAYKKMSNGFITVDKSVIENENIHLRNILEDNRVEDTINRFFQLQNIKHISEYTTLYTHPYTFVGSPQYEINDEYSSVLSNVEFILFNLDSTKSNNNTIYINTPYNNIISMLFKDIKFITECDNNDINYANAYILDNYVSFVELLLLINTDKPRLFKLYIDISDLSELLTNFCIYIKNANVFYPIYNNTNKFCITFIYDNTRTHLESLYMEEFMNSSDDDKIVDTTNDKIVDKVVDHMTYFTNCAKLHLYKMIRVLPNTDNCYDCKVYTSINANYKKIYKKNIFKE